jgi:hypothetical protein
MTEEEFAQEKKLAHEKALAAEMGSASARGNGAVSPLVVVLAWLAVGIPLAWGTYRTLVAAAKFFN